MMKKIILDANAILRYILNDLPEQAGKTEEILKTRKVIILSEVIEEVIYIMQKYYSYSDANIQKHLCLFLDDASCSDTKLRNAIIRYGTSKFDFVDCMLFEYSKTYDIFTFDKDLNKLIARGIL